MSPTVAAKAYTVASPVLPTANVVRPAFANPFPAFVIGSQFSPRSAEMYKLPGPKPGVPKNWTFSFSCTEASQPALVLTRLQTGFPRNALTGINVFPPLTDRN